MRVEDIAYIMGKSKEEVYAMLCRDDVIEVKLVEKKEKPYLEKGNVELLA